MALRVISWLVSHHKERGPPPTSIGGWEWAGGGTPRSLWSLLEAFQAAWGQGSMIVLHFSAEDTLPVLLCAQLLTENCFCPIIFLFHIRSGVFYNSPECWNEANGPFLQLFPVSRTCSHCTVFETPNLPLPKCSRGCFVKQDVVDPFWTFSFVCLRV